MLSVPSGSRAVLDKAFRALSGTRVHLNKSLPQRGHLRLGSHGQMTTAFSYRRESVHIIKPSSRVMLCICVFVSR